MNKWWRKLRKAHKKGYNQGYKKAVKTQKNWYEIQLRVLRSGQKTALKEVRKMHHEELAMLNKEHRKKIQANEEKTKKELKKAQQMIRDYEKLKQKWSEKVSYVENMIHELELIDRSKSNMVTEILTRAALLNKRDIKIDNIRQKYQELIANTIQEDQTKLIQ